MTPSNGSTGSDGDFGLVGEIDAVFARADIFLRVSFEIAFEIFISLIACVWIWVD
tara:strand:+ start:556 stop:720 length:165 start_codon:yes stop_codon:yes gene_type:complete